ncbi:hypothetical protein ATANTOWER_007888 [Ataeniobius toweri]|uniref:Uncharacterized protein n=1 Tax=Ataeniobius toweri TaxID=208326 RepID=A0ABU7CJB4_9TELE|nr:hypothetical protein [Ataeniobius toweri]
MIIDSDTNTVLARLNLHHSGDFNHLYGPSFHCKQSHNRTLFLTQSSTMTVWTEAEVTGEQKDKLWPELFIKHYNIVQNWFQKIGSDRYQPLINDLTESKMFCCAWFVLGFSWTNAVVYFMCLSSQTPSLS